MLPGRLGTAGLGPLTDPFTKLLLLQITVWVVGAVDISCESDEVVDELDVLSNVELELLASLLLLLLFPGSMRCSSTPESDCIPGKVKPIGGGRFGTFGGGCVGFSRIGCLGCLLLGDIAVGDVSFWEITSILFIFNVLGFVAFVSVKINKKKD